MDQEIVVGISLPLVLQKLIHYRLPCLQPGDPVCTWWQPGGHNAPMLRKGAIMTHTLFRSRLRRTAPHRAQSEIYVCQMKDRLHRFALRHITKLEPSRAMSFSVN